jgi:hypothetical protein
MKNVFLVVSSFLIFASLAWSLEIIPPVIPQDTSKLTGREIIDIMDRYNDSYTESVDFKLEVKQNGKLLDERQGIIRSIKFKQGNEILGKSLFRFTTSVKRGVTFLSIEASGAADNEQYLYLPSLKRPRRLAVTERQNDFEDTDLTNEDLGGKKIDDYTYERKQKDETVDGAECFSVIARSKKTDARFPKKKMLISKKYFLPIQVQYYDKDGKLDRALKFTGITEFKSSSNKSGLIHMPLGIYAKNMKTNHETLITISATGVKVDSPLKESDFVSEKMNL